MESITESVLRYQESGKGYEEIVKRISLIIYNYPVRIQNLTEDDKSEFYLSFYNRIEGLIKNFSYMGIPFETLLNQTLKWHIKTYVSKKKDEKRLIALQVQEAETDIKDLLSDDYKNEYNEIPLLKLKGCASRRRLLFLVLVDSPNISDKEMKSFSKITGYELEWLFFLKDTLINRLFKRNKRLTQLREKRNNTYMKLLYKQSLYSDEIDREKKEIISDQINRLKKRLDDTRYEISRVPCRPTHPEIAELLKVPKCTVDSGLHYFRKKYKTAIAENSYSLFL
ncbi:MAG: hypothetical protein PF518_00675 [Spirochaetaceae bacterium]|jgi:hypothetical protein|nr:hypothetical protein [Spirochaetaceae bacterium]